MKPTKIQLEIEVTEEILSAFQLGFDLSTLMPDKKPLEALKIVLEQEVGKDIQDTLQFYRRFGKGKVTGNHYLLEK